MESLSDMVYVKDLHGNYISVNKAFADTVGKSKKDIVGRTDTDLLGDSLAIEIASHEQRLVKQGGSVEYELRYATKSAVIHFRSRKTLLHDRQGVATGILGISRDVTRETQAETKYRFIFDNAPIAFWEEDFSSVKKLLDELKASGVKDFPLHFKQHPEVLEECIARVRIVDVNLATMRMNRANNKPLLISDLKRKFTEDSQKVFIEEFSALAEGRTFYRSEASTIDLGEERLDVLFHMNVLPGHEDSLSSVLISVIDISPLKRTEGQLSQIRELYRSVVDGQREMICRFLPKGKLSFLNVAFRQFFEREGTDLSKVCFHELFPDSSDHDCVEKLDALNPSSPTCSFEVYNYDHEGNVVWQQWSINALYTKDGQASEYQAVGTDITMRKEAESRLAASEARWRSVFENAEDLILTVNSSSFILSSNEPANQAAGYRLAGHLLTEVMDSENRDFVQQTVQKVFQQQTLVRSEFKISSGPIAGRLLSCVLTPIFHGDRVLSATLIARDITESRRLENRIREALIEGQENERKRVSRELHDGIGQLFTAIKMNMQHLRNGLGEGMSENVSERLKLLEHNIGVAIDEVKHISHNLMPEVLEQFGLRPAMEDLVKTWNSTGNVSVNLETVGINDPLPAQMELSLFRMAQELITNSVRHSGASSVFVQLIGHGPSIVLMVEDDGKGFDPEEDSGGLGLRNIRSRAELLEGSVEIDSALGKGTVTTIEIPLKTIADDTSTDSR